MDFCWCIIACGCFLGGLDLISVFVFGCAFRAFCVDVHSRVHSSSRGKSTSSREHPQARVEIPQARGERTQARVEIHKAP